jgi:hypothetical protein
MSRRSCELIGERAQRTRMMMDESVNTRSGITSIQVLSNKGAYEDEQEWGQAEIRVLRTARPHFRKP